MIRRTFIDCTQDQTQADHSRIARLIAVANELWEAGDLIGRDKIANVVDHIRSEIEFRKDSFTKSLDDNFPARGM
ncbi:MAG: hypothetical protein JWO78_171 [Micavibrio sp.]|nr:hypothetical protein [Micavibrio sp.]